MKLFEEPKIDVIRFVTENVLSESEGGVTLPEVTMPDNWLPIG